MISSCDDVLGKPITQCDLTLERDPYIENFYLFIIIIFVVVVISYVVVIIC
jgi:hypothetical protein